MPWNSRHFSREQIPFRRCRHLRTRSDRVNHRTDNGLRDGIGIDRKMLGMMHRKALASSALISPRDTRTHSQNAACSNSCNAWKQMTTQAQLLAGTTSVSTAAFCHGSSFAQSEQHCGSLLAPTLSHRQPSYSRPVTAWLPAPRLHPFRRTLLSTRRWCASTRPPPAPHLPLCAPPLTASAPIQGDSRIFLPTA